MFALNQFRAYCDIMSVALQHANYSLLTHTRLAFKSTSTTTTAITLRRIQTFITTTSIRTKTSTSTTTPTKTKNPLTTTTTITMVRFQTLMTAITTATTATTIANYSLLTRDSHLLYINNNYNHNRTLADVCKLT